MSAIFALSLGLLGAEAVLRIFEGSAGPLRIPDPLRHHALAPLQSRTERWGGARVTVATNSLGMRDRSPTVVPLTNRDARRILFLGDSFTEGMGVEFAETIPALVEVALRSETGPDGQYPSRPIECLNAGLSSYSPLLEHRTLLQLHERGLKFDHLVILVDTSDPQDELIYRRSLGVLGEDAPLELPITAGIVNERGLFYTDTGLWWYRHSALARKLWRTSRHFEPRWIWRDGLRQDRERWATDPELIARWGNRGIELMLASLDRILDHASQMGVSVHLVVYPWPYQIEAGRASPSTPAILAERLDEYCSQHGVPLINLYPLFLAQENWTDLFVTGDVHWNPAGHRLVAWEIAKELSIDPLPPKAAARQALAAPSLLEPR